MNDLRMFATGALALPGQTFEHLDDFEAALITWHNQVLAWRAVETGHCPNPRCHAQPHPDHPQGHVITGDTYPDRKDRLEGRLR